MEFVIAIEKPANENECFGVIVPDLPGCYSSGETVEEAVKNAKEAIEMHIEGLRVDGEEIPFQNSLEFHKGNPEFQDLILRVVDIDL